MQKRITTLPKLLVVAGPTASGKTDLALRLAKRFKGEVISADSRQFYKGTEIGSDIIPGTWVRKFGRRTYIAHGVPHYLTAFLSPSKPFSAAQFKDHVIRIARDITKRGHLPILCGGTGLYIRAVVDNFNLGEIPSDQAFRDRMEKRSAAALYRELAKKDPAYAARIPASNKRYAIRALEVMRATGKTVTESQSKGEPLFDVLQIGIKRPVDVANARIDARVDDMMKRGLLDEARKLGKKYGWAAPAMTGLGHRQLGQFLRGEIPLEEAVRLIKRDTRRYAKRQRAWLKRDERIQWVKSVRGAETLVKRHLSSGRFKAKLSAKT
jgi:tRNA dimethylallyltransferase